MKLEKRITLLEKLGQYFLNDSQQWQEVRTIAYQHNPWFLPKYIKENSEHIARAFINGKALTTWIKPYNSFANVEKSPELGLVMAGNIPLVGFHDFLAGFLSGSRLRIKLSSKDKILWRHIYQFLLQEEAEIESLISFEEQLKNCDGYIATGSNNSARYFEYYFSKYPSIIRRNRSSMAVLDGKETDNQLKGLCKDICLYFGLGCRNVTQLLVPEGYDFTALKNALKAYEYHLDYNRYKNNYDYQLALALLNKIDYQVADPVLLVRSESIFAPLGVLHYEQYSDKNNLLNKLPKERDLQCLISEAKGLLPQKTLIPFGKSQYPRLEDYADGVNTLQFLNELMDN